MAAFQQSGNAPPIVGIEIGTKSQSKTVGDHIEKAFKSIGIEPNQTTITNNNYTDDYVVIFIGVKPN